MSKQEAEKQLEQWRAEGIDGYIVKFGGEYYCLISAYKNILEGDSCLC